MPQAIKQFNGLCDGSSTFQQTTVYTCPANTIAIVLPNCLFMATTSNGIATLGYNSSSVTHTTSPSSGSGNYGVDGIDVTYPYQITHDGKHNVKIAVQGHRTGSNMYYTPNFASTSLRSPYSGYAQLENWAASNTSLEPVQGGWVAGSITRLNSSNAPFFPNDFIVGTWNMGAGHKLSLAAQSVRIQYSFLIIEEAA